MRFRRHRREDVQVNLTPLIDVVFLLLIFFMVSTTFTRETQLEIDLPESTSDQAATESPSLEIMVDGQGRYAVNDQPLLRHDSDTLKQALTELAGNRRDQTVVITGDAQAPHQAMIYALDAVGQLGFTKVSYTTRLPDSP
ncbi:biopolymer transporter ExbD [Saccharospirillum sp. MSK14-1]|uniref:ExbD/TolR family protein n=1 Tax=Saccharospirillum sp. MSK14-1 TaxID=1897632 RepID=UPI000D35ECC4|nr:biopolymer transporter ExbD [Saccharospirillum sp. MSK14-1]PTY36644.1 biopolymer transporter ExbD [Saccharospirillum sp. MSK14-1]